MNSEQIEKYSSAITLSDMEVFIYPELMYSLVLANIMSPVLWRWRQESSFKKLKGKNSYRKLMRFKQYVMDEFEFNLDLETWGLTNQQKEIKRFEHILSPHEISRSNALFGYEGDKYYFDVDIRRHFGLDKYNSDIIPYWKTETVEAMMAFRRKPGYTVGAGECVSLAALYAAAAFVVCEVPLEDIFMVLTPLHSQNFLDVNDGVLTNNRRLVTKSMWFNGTETSMKAQRALRNEQVTIVAHNSGYVHCIYQDATINKGQYDRFRKILGKYLTAELDMRTFANFLRCYSQYQKYFQVCRDCRGKPQFLKAEILFHYEHGSDYRIAESTHDKLLEEVNEEDFVNYQLPGRIRCDELDKFLNQNRLELRTQAGTEKIFEWVKAFIPNAETFVRELADFVHMEPRLPAGEKKYHKSKQIELTTQMNREDVIEYLQSIRNESETAELAFYAYRDMKSCDWQPFVNAAIERNPVSIELAGCVSADEAYGWLQKMDRESIYEGSRLAQPDEVANYRTGDGLEKVFTLANLVLSQAPDSCVTLKCSGNIAVLTVGDKEFPFETNKGLEKELNLCHGTAEVNK